MFGSAFLSNLKWYHGEKLRDYYQRKDIKHKKGNFFCNKICKGIDFETMVILIRVKGF